ncbi:hypothetical protein WALSEDRAFT_62446 [Wallemia mellicola CBS 633.66]|uniref:Hydrophobin n=1 Tax=Wallemia mellicola (strain ATCC MYA-4683 / CBS 633.66) TaxID=671144 RepID=I4YII5_WALMC|nr:hypothetical protein WALSEDRAFT_62446 [Wallemia mellicola CBS 633.66]EIM23777.1 hypothetical protein WALSEDRAFT_62446 [Wallemia mellicola CBS 633.66]|eukprot:XP_006956440.1 hypothetical protein WALSEDRAFT_62446 [Wallemia mellicola CBS 633.66]
MFKTTVISALLASATLVSAGGPAEICTSKGGTSCTEYQITKDCCAAVDQNTRFDEVFTQCIPLLANGINTGGMVECCESRGAGSAEVKIGADKLVCTGGPAEICTSKGGTSCTEYQITKDCCAAVDQNTRFDEVFTQCIPLLANGINTGGMVECCESRGAGSAEVKIGADKLVCSR